MQKSKQPQTVRHTVTSYRRMLLKNPLIVKSNEGVVPKSFNQNELEHYKALVEAASLKYKEKKELDKKEQELLIEKEEKVEKKQFRKVELNRFSVNPGKSNILRHNTCKNLNASRVNSQNSKYNREEKNVLVQNIKKEKPIKNTLSALHIEKKKGIAMNPEKCFTRKSVYSPMRLSQAKSLPNFTNIPKIAVRNVNDYDKVQKALTKWLNKEAIPTEDCHVIKKCFLDENKENLDVDDNYDKGSYEDLGITEPDNQIEKEVNVQTVLDELMKLILKKCPANVCSKILQLIGEKFEGVSENPLFWECRAAIEKLRDKNAFMPESNEMDNQLSNCFKLLSINSTPYKGCEKKNFTEVINSAAIKFSATSPKRERNSTLITPVRRSTRKSKSFFRETPNVKVYETVEEAIKNSSNLKVTFKPNALLF